MKSAYIAAPFARKEEARRVRSFLEKLGVASTARWIDTHLAEDLTPQESTIEAYEDLHDIHRADAFILLHYGPMIHEGQGKHIEFGYALAKGKRIIIVGVPTSIFHHHSSVEIVPNVEDIEVRRAA